MLTIRQSADIIEKYQDPSGAYVACPNFPTYAYCWLRDGSFIAYGMLKAGRPASARSFLAWTSRALLGQAGRLGPLRASAAAGRGADGLHLPTRYALDGTAVEDDWPNFQVDGYGTWLWCLDEYAAATGEETFLGELLPAVDATLEYLELTWDLPNYDCWEERGNLRHPATLACVYGGASRMAVRFRGTRRGDRWERLAAGTRALIGSMALPDGRFPKSEGFPSVDASLLWLALPFGAVDADDPRMAATVAAIEAGCLVGGGVKRYPEDTYYGGGRWIILSAWLGWWYAAAGRREEAEAVLAWIESTADAAGELPEQTTDVAVDVSRLKEWTDRWGPVAKPLLWSHAMHIVLADAVSRQS